MNLTREEAAIFADEGIFAGSKRISCQLLDVEILYSLNSGPRSVDNLRSTLQKIFDFFPEITTVSMRTSELKSQGLIMTLDSSGQAVYAITPRGMNFLGRSIDTISQIALTMQLGLNQRLLKI